jgi:hypothetical protein
MASLRNSSDGLTIHIHQDGWRYFRYAAVGKFGGPVMVRFGEERSANLHHYHSPPYITACLCHATVTRFIHSMQ